MRNPVHLASHQPSRTLAERSFWLALVIAATIVHTPDVTAAQPASTHARAGAAAVLVYGKADARSREVVQASLEEAAKAAGWTLAAPAPGRDQAQLVVCLDATRPWPCISNIAARQDFGRVLAVSVERGAKGEIVLSGRLVTDADTAPSANQRFCTHCSERDLEARVKDLAQQLIAASSIRSGSTTIEVRTIPPGAVVTLDSQMVGGAATAIPTSPGTHTVQLELSGYEPEVRQVTVREGETVKVELHLRPLRAAEVLDLRHPVSAPPQRNRFPRWLPPTLIGTGGAAIVIGSWISLSADSGVGTKQTRYDYSVPGLALVGVGALAVGGGMVLWWWPQKRPAQRSATTMVLPLRDGALAGFSARF